MLRLELNVCRAELVHFSNLLLVAEPEREAVDDVWEEGAVVEAATLLLPALSPSTKYAAFAETLARARDGDTESCAAECSRCLDI